MQYMPTVYQELSLKFSIYSLLCLLISTPTFSATPDAWGEFAQHIETECRSLVAEGESQLKNLNVIVHQYDGVVLLIGVDTQGDEVLTVCVYDKVESVAWISDRVALRSLRPSAKK